VCPKSDWIRVSAGGLHNVQIYVSNGTTKPSTPTWSSTFSSNGGSITRVIQDYEAYYWVDSAGSPSSSYSCFEVSVIDPA